MRDGAAFVRKKRAQLRLKYMRRSLRGFTKRPLRASDARQLQRIDELYSEFIDYAAK